MGSRTERIRVDPVRPEPDAIARAAAVISRGGLVAFPTETVYGLGANGLCEDAVAGIFRAKGRPAANPVLLHIATADDVLTIARDIPHFVSRLMSRFWPGPLALVLFRRPGVPDIVTAGGDKVGIRLPDHNVARELVARAGVPLAAPSANASGKISPTTADHVLADLEGRIDMVLDAGPTGLGIESTVLDVTEWPPVVVRPGGISVEALTAELGVVPVIGKGARPDLPRYQGRAEIVVVEGEPSDRIQRLRQLAANLVGSRAAALISSETAAELELFPLPMIISGSVSDPSGIASRLFGALRDLSEANDVVLVEGVGETGIGRAVMDRLRAAGGKSADDRPRILIVCTGNTCRSPMAQALLIRAGAGMPLTVRSAGTAAVGGPASSHALTSMSELGLELQGHRARSISRELLDWADLVLCMAEQHREAVLSIDPSAAGRTFLWQEYAGERGDVPDPFGGCLEVYRECRDLLSRQAGRIAARLRNEAGNRRRDREATTDGRGDGV